MSQGRKDLSSVRILIPLCEGRLEELPLPDTSQQRRNCPHEGGLTE